ncbi:uncharacterized protein BDW43DRAFT_268611 [Aspergillus alliaceus]|uniref:uncharacterized protein n=1 Tax=Petromyces alliaceus TaxID=209559 RepID=UPI0012A5A24A|nr:uncharacterized protein BDW43DRAFT_268611 [Aspergillus alliaceus]KAB8235917.1 hypothetical protein BDW43DRAFT_268611 [Aspergillus alliaceus]
MSGRSRAVHRYTHSFIDLTLSPCSQLHIPLGNGNTVGAIPYFLGRGFHHLIYYGIRIRPKFQRRYRGEVQLEKLCNLKREGVAQGGFTRQSH